MEKRRSTGVVNIPHVEARQRRPRDPERLPPPGFICPDPELSSSSALLSLSSRQAGGDGVLLNKRFLGKFSNSRDGHVLFRLPVKISDTRAFLFTVEG